MPCYEKDGESEVESVVDVVVVDDDGGGENDPDGDDGCSGRLEGRRGRALCGGRSGGRRRQSILVISVSVLGVKQLLVDAVTAGRSGTEVNFYVFDVIVLAAAHGGEPEDGLVVVVVVIARKRVARRVV